MKRVQFIAALLFAFVVPVSAQQAEVPSAPAIFARVSEQPVSFEDLPPPRQFLTRHTTTIRGKRLAYRAIAAERYITNLSGEPIARFFSFSYIRDPQDGARPVMFVFNGGPGSSSIWLHMGIFGPKRVALDQEVDPSNTPPFGAVDNPHSVLDVADLVFIDPVGTGFSEAVGNARTADFASVDADAESVARFIELWLTQHGRWNSPKYLVGESYGSIRAAVLARALMGGALYTTVMRGITLDGVILVGQALHVGVKFPEGTVRPDPASVLLPSLAVTAWYHDKLDRPGKTAAEVYEQAKQFGATEYALGLAKLDRGLLSDAEQDQLASKLQAHTGLAADVWKRSKLRLSADEFCKQIIAERGKAVGMYDSRYTMPLAGSGGDPVSDDPAMGRYVPGFITAFNMVLRDHLQVSMPIPYTPIAFNLAYTWDFSRSGVPEGQSFAVDLATAMRRTPALRVLFATGYYDMLATPASAENQIKQGGLPLDRVTFKTYESGHMLYLGGTAASFADDVRAFVGQVLAVDNQAA